MPGMVRAGTVRVMAPVTAGKEMGMKGSGSARGAAWSRDSRVQARTLLCNDNC